MADRPELTSPRRAARASRALCLALCLVAGITASLVAGSPADAQSPSARQKPGAVLELFTSQGCSSCPAADALFFELAKNPQFLVLTMPVDYWDYLGWKDTLAHSAFSQRQRAYAKMRGDGQIYTPQAVVSGVAHAVGSDRRAIEQTVAALKPVGLPLDVAITEAGGQVRISVSGSARPGSVWVVPVARSRTVSIQRGENRGREVAYVNVARGLTRVGEWRGEDLAINLPVSAVRQADADTYVVLVHSDEGKIGRIIGAATAPGF